MAFIVGCLVGGFVSVFAMKPRGVLLHTASSSRAAGRASEPTAEVLGELASDAGPSLQAFVTGVLTPANIRRTPAQSADPVVRLPGTKPRG